MTRLAFVLDGGREVIIPLAGDMPLGRLAEVTAAVEDAQASHQQWEESLRRLEAEYQHKTEVLREITAQHEVKASEVRRLKAAEAAARSELESLTGRKDETLTQLQEFSGRCAVDQARAEVLSRELSALTERCLAEREEAEHHESLTKAAKHELGLLELRSQKVQAELQNRSHELENTEEKLRHAQALSEEEAARFQALSSAVLIFAEQRQQSEAAVTELEARVAQLRGECQQAVGSAKAAHVAHQNAEMDLHAVQADLKIHQDRLADTQSAYAIVQARFNDTNEKLSAIELDLDARQQVLGCTGQSLDLAIGRLSATEHTLAAAVQSLASVEEKLAAVSQRFDFSAQALAATEEDLACGQDMLCDMRQQLTATEAALFRTTQSLQDTRQKLTAIEQQHAEATTQLACQQQQVAASAARHAEIQAAVSLGAAKIASFEGTLDRLKEEEAAIQSRIETLSTEEQDLRSGLQRLGAAERTVRARYEETRSIAEEAEKERLTRDEELNRNAAAVRLELAELETRLIPLRDWKERMDQCQARLTGLPPDSLEARNLRNEIEMAMAGLRHLLSCVPQSRARSMSSQSSSGTGLEAALNTRLNRLRETMQREESRLDFLRQERERQELRSRTRPAIAPALRDQESKIRLAEEQLAITETKIKHAAVEEQNYRDKIAALSLQLAELRTEFSNAPETSAPLAS
jgi:chromosome segregation ATPase